MRNLLQSNTYAKIRQYRIIPAYKNQVESSRYHVSLFYPRLTFTDIEDDPFIPGNNVIPYPSYESTIISRNPEDGSTGQPINFTSIYDASF